MSEVVGLVRAGWISATSYRVSFLISLGAVALGVVPLYFISDAIQPIAAESIRGEGGHYFGFVLLGLVAFRYLQVAIGAIPSTLSGWISSGTLEALLNTPARIPMLLAGFLAFPVLWTTFTAAVMVAGGRVLGVEIAWPRLIVAVPILLLLVAAYVPISLISSAFVLVFRTGTPLGSGVLALSSLLGGVYYSTSVIPSWMGSISGLIPLTYGLRALRRVLLEGLPLLEVVPDLVALAAIGGALAVIGVPAFAFGLRHARRAGTLSQY